MKRLLLLTSVSAMSLFAFADEVKPLVIEDALISELSPNGKYGVSQGLSGLRIFNIETGEEYTQFTGTGYETYDPGQGKCVSNDGIIVGSSEDSEPCYWKDGAWYRLPLPPNAQSSNHAQAISADGSRICGLLGVSQVNYDEDALMTAPCIWNAEGDGYGLPIVLPHPDLDFAGRVPMYITAVDMSEDGKVIIGQVLDATGMFNYPILYKENEQGEWSYEIPFEDLINPDHLEIVPFPGEGPTMPQMESFMTPDEIEAYQQAYQEYVDSNYQLPYPEYWYFMTKEEIDAYNEAVDIYNAKAEAYNEKWYAWWEFLKSVIESSPGYVFNTERISPDGKTYGCTVQKVGDRDPNTGMQIVENSVWMFDTTSGKISKYEKDGDLNMFYIANDGIGIATTMAGTASNSYILKGGNVIDMLTWMNTKVPAYASWMEDNMVFTYEEEEYDEELQGYVINLKEGVLTGRATSTPDLSVMALSVQNIWDFTDDGIAYVFDMVNGSGVETVAPASEENSIYDLSGRKLKSVTAPGIYIINGEKKVVR